MKLSPWPSRTPKDPQIGLLEEFGRPSGRRVGIVAGMTIASEAVLAEASASVRTTQVPYAPSALTRLFAAIERLPLGGWWVYPLSYLALVVYHTVSLWFTGSSPVGSVSLDGLDGLAYGPS